MRGDDPVAGYAVIKLSGVPRMRGDDPLGVGIELAPGDAFPACAGMIRSYADGRGYDGWSSRMRGDDPAPENQLIITAKSSPHARG